MRKIIIDTYRNLRRITPSSINGTVSKLAFKIRNRPLLKKDNIDPTVKFPAREKGGLIISADFELAWAWRYTKTGLDHIKKGRAERENFPKIIKIFEEFGIPITFATVGHLLLKQCKINDHDWMARIPHFDDHWRFTNGDWYDHDPCSSYSDAPEWYAPDLINLILNSKVAHEIGSHTFSHIDFSDKNCPSQVADDELKACIEASKPYGIELKSIVFPGGTWGNIEVLKKYGIQIYRRNLEYDIAYPYRDGFGLLVSPSSGCLEYNLKYGWSSEYYVRRLKKIVEKAIKTNSVAHLWFHPSLKPWILSNIFPPFLEYAALQKGEGVLWIGSMKDIAEYINKNEIL